MRPTLLAFLAFATFAHGQDTQLPTVDDVKSLRVKFEEERAAALKAGADKRFMPGLVDRATTMANKAEAAREAGRLLQASEFYRQARWQLPYLSPKLPEHVSRVLGNFRLRHGMDITCVAYSPDGKYLASGSRDRFVKIWDLANGRETVAYAGHADVIHALAFSPDGKAVASSGNGPEIRLWSPEDGKEIRKFDGSGKDVKAIAFSKDGKYLISGQTSKAGGSGGIVAVHEVATGQLTREVRDFGNLVSCVAFNAKGNILAVGVGTGLLRLYEFPKMVDQPDQPEYWTHQDNYGGTYDIAFSPDDRLLIRTGADGIKIYPLAQPGAAFQAAAPLRTLGNLGGIRYTVCHVSANSKTLFAGDSAGTLRSFDLETGQLIGELKGHTGEIRNMAMQPRGGQLATAGSDYMIRLWDFDVVMQARDFVGHEGPVWSAAFSPDGRRVVSASADQTLRVWDVLDAASVRVLKGHGGPVTMALFTPDGKKIISAGVDRTIKIWDAETGNITQELTGHIGTITALAVSDDGKLIVSGGADRMVKAWDVASGKVLLSVAGHDAVVAAVAIHPDGKRIAVGSVDP